MHSKETAMDEYLFLVAAKLKVDRLRAPHEQRMQLEMPPVSWARPEARRTTAERGVRKPSFEIELKEQP
jgi:hypothetical protein